MKWPNIDLTSFYRQGKISSAHSPLSQGNGLKVWILLNISSWSYSHRAVLFKQMALLSYSLKNFSDSMNFCDGLGQVLPHGLCLKAIFLTSHFVKPVPFLGDVFSLWCALCSLIHPSLAAWLIRMKRSTWGLTLSALHSASYPGKIIMYQSLHLESTAHPESLVVNLGKSLHHSSSISSGVNGDKMLGGYNELICGKGLMYNKHSVRWLLLRHTFILNRNP